MTDGTHYFVYVLLCADKSLYTGITNNVKARLEMHDAGKGSKYVRSRLPFQLLHTEEFATKSDALKREFEIKSWSRKEKIRKLKLKLN